MFLAPRIPSALIILSTSPPFCSGHIILDPEKPTWDPRYWPAGYKERNGRESEPNYGLVFSAPLLCFFTKLFGLILSGGSRTGARPPYS